VAAAAGAINFNSRKAFFTQLDASDYTDADADEQSVHGFAFRDEWSTFFRLAK